MTAIERELKKDYYKIIFENSEEGIWLIDENSKTIVVNNKLAQMLGYTPEEMRGRNIIEFMDQSQVEKAKVSVQRRRDGYREQHEFLLQQKNKKFIWTLMASSPITSSEGEYLGAVAFVSDLTSRKRSDVLLKAQSKIFELLAAKGSLGDALDILITSIETLLPGVKGSVLLLNDDKKSVSCASAPHLPIDFSCALNGAPIGPREGSCGTAMFIKEKVIVSDIKNDPLWENYKVLAIKHNLLACWANPIMTYNGDVLGSFAMYFSECREPSLDELELVNDFTAAALLSIEYINSRKREEGQKKRSSLLADTREVLAHHLDFRAVLRKIPGLIVKDFADWCFIILPKEDGGTELLAAGTKDKADLVKAFNSFRPDMSSKNGIAKAMREMTSVLYSEISEDNLASSEPMVSTKDPFFLDQIKKLGLQSFMASPFIVRGKAIGGLSVFSSNPKRLFRASDLEVLQQIADSCAMTIDNSILYSEAQKTIKSREEFISVASHELRTPLTSIKLRLDLLSRMISSATLPEKFTAAIRPVLSKIHPDVDRFSILVDTLLDISRLNSKQMQLSKENCDLSIILLETVDRLRPEFILKSTELVVHIDSNLFGAFDIMRLQQVITNLLMNALKFGQEKPIEFSAKRQHDFVELIVKDQGIGIPEADLSRIFKPFERAVSDKHFGGLGLGLYITLQIVEAHSGSIQVESHPGNGTTFKVRLPSIKISDV